MADWAPPESDFAPAPTAGWSPPESDFQSSAAPPASSPDETPGRVAGLTARAVGRGVADVPGAISSLTLPGIMSTAASAGQPIAHAIRRAVGVEQPAPEQPETNAPPKPPRETKLSDFIHPEHWADAVDYLADKAGLAKPETPTERVLSKAGEAVPSAVLAPETPISGALSAAAGAAASQGAKEANLSPVAQTAAGLAAGSLPVAGTALSATTKGLVRGGAEGQAAMKGRIADAANAGTTLSAGQASGSPLLQYLEGAISKLWGGGPINKLAGKQAEGIGKHVGEIVDNLSGGTTPSPAAAGTAINTGADIAKENMRKAEGAAYGKLHGLVPPDTPIDVSGTLAKLDELTQPVEGAEATTGALVPPKIKAMRDNLTADMASNAAKKTPPAQTVLEDKQSGTMPYNAVRQLRTRLGNNEIDWGFAPADPVANRSLIQVYSALSKDLTEGAAKVGPEAEQAAKEANALYAANSDKRDFLHGIIEKAGGPELVYQAATNGTKLGATKIAGVMSALQPEQRDLVRATVLSRLGRALPSAQNAEGSAFNPTTFLTNWSKLHPEAQDALFGASGNAGDLRSSLDSLTNTMSNIRSGTKLRNPSGTGEAVGHGAGAIALFEGLTHLMSGHPGMLASTVGGVAANQMLSRALTNPTTVKWLAETAKLPRSAIPNAVNQLTQMNDPAAQELANYLSAPPPTSRATGGRVGIDSLVNRLMSRWKSAKRETDESTKPLLKVPDATITRALEIAKAHI